MSDFHEVRHPYPGLRPFESWEGEIFFGREEHTNRLLDILQQQRFLAIIGPSGSGKSSLVRAGLLPSLPLGSLGTGSDWRIAVMRPGHRPIQRLAQALMASSVIGIELIGEERKSHDDKELSADVALIEAELRRGPLGLLDIVKDARALHPKGELFNLLILVDQFEELFTYSDAGGPQADESEAFVNLLLSNRGIQDDRVFMVLTMRTDFLGNCVRFLELPDAINRAQYLTPRLTREQIAKAITCPAHLFDGDVETSLVAELINAVSNAPDQLPILQHALARMWDRASRRHPDPICITWDDFKAVGGIRNVLSHHADELLAALSSNNAIDAPFCPEQLAAELLFRAITDQRSSEAGSQAVRRPQSLKLIADWSGRKWEEFIPVVKTFAKEGINFLNYQGELGENTVVDISHEALIRQWDRLRHWVQQEFWLASEYKRLRDQAIDWRNCELMKKGSGTLLTGSNLVRALEWQEGRLSGAIGRPTLSWAKRYKKMKDDPFGTEFVAVLDFIKNSHAGILRTQSRERKNKMMLSGLTALSVLAMTMALGFAWKSHNSQLEAESALLWTPLDFTDSNISGKQAEGLLQLARADDSQKYVFIDQFLMDKSLAGRFNKNPGAVISALAGVNPEIRSKFLRRLNSPIVNQPTEDAFRIARVLALLELEGDVSINDIIEASGTKDDDRALIAIGILMQRLEKDAAGVPEKQVGAVTDLLIDTIMDSKIVYPSWHNVLLALVSRSPETRIGLVVNKLIDAIKIAEKPSILKTLGSVLATVSAKASEAQAHILIDRFFAERRMLDDASRLQALDQGLASAASKVPVTESDAIIARLIETIRITDNVGQLNSLGDGLAAVIAKAPEARTAMIIDKFIDEIRNTSGEDQLQTLGLGLQEAAAKLDEDEASGMIKKFTVAIKKAKVNGQRQFLGYGLAVVLAKMPEIVPLIIDSMDSGRIRSFSKGLLATAGNVPEAGAYALATRYFIVMKKTKNFQLLQILGEALAEAAARIPESQAYGLTNKFYEAMKKTEDSFLFQTLGKGLAAAAAKVPEAQAGAVVSRLFTAMKNTADSGKLQTLGIGLSAASGKIPESQAGALADHYIAEITNTRNEFFGDALAAVVLRVPETQAAAMAHKMFSVMKDTQDSFLLQTLGNGLAVVAAKVPEAQSEAIVDRFFTALKEARETDKIQILGKGLAEVAARIPEEHADTVAKKLISEIRDDQIFNQARELNQELAVLVWVNQQGLRRHYQLKALGQGLASAAARASDNESAAIAHRIFRAMRSVIGSSSYPNQFNVPKNKPNTPAQESRVNQLLVQSGGVSLSAEQLEALGQGFVAVASRVPEAEAKALLKELGNAVWGTRDVAELQVLDRSLRAISGRIKADETSAQILFDVLKNPLIPRDGLVKSLRTLFSSTYSGSSGFWAFAEWAQTQFPDLDLHTLPKEPDETQARLQVMERVI